MRKNYIILLLCLVIGAANAQVTRIYTDFNNFWTSSSTSINSVQPNLSHNLLAFRWNGTTYSTGVDDDKLTANGITFQNTKFRALPITTVPLTSSAGSSGPYYIGVGALSDGLANTTSNTFINPQITTGEMKAAYLTMGANGLDLGTGLTNIPTGSTLTFNLSANGITLANVGDGVPDILVSQIAQPTNTGVDQLYFQDLNGNTVGNAISINLSNETLFPTVGNWNVDFYNNNSTADTGFINTNRTIKFFTADLSQFGINSSNYSSARKLIYKPGGTSDPAFIAYNEPSIGVAQQLVITSQPTTSDCDGYMPTSFIVRLADSFGDYVEQAGYTVTAYMETGPGQLLGTTTVTTNAQGIATFNDLYFEVGGDHVIRFENTSLRDAISTTITGPDCSANIWTGNVDSDWNNTGNWQTASVPNANNNVTIPAGRPNYPVLIANAGAKDLVMGEGATIDLNGYLFTIKGNITKDATAEIDAADAGSELYMSGTSAQTIPDGFIKDDRITNFTVENAGGVITLNPMYLTGVARVRSGNFNTNDMLTLVCSFSPQRTGQIGVLNGTISGTVTTEQCFPARRAFRLISASVSTTTSIRENWQEDATTWEDDPEPGYGTHITGAGSSGSDPLLTDGVNGFDWQPSGAPSMFTFNNSTQTWNAVTSTLGTLTAGTPYRILIRGSRSTDITSNSSAPTNTKLRTTGTVVKGPVAVTDLSTTSGGYSFVGNPFHAIVDMNRVMSNSYNLTSFYYVWDPKVGGTPTVGQPGGRGGYVAINAATGAKSNASSAATRFLQPYQAFFVQTSTLGGAPQLTFNESDKRPTAAQTAVFRTFGNPFIDLNLYYQDTFDAGDTSSDGLRIDFREGENNEVDVNDAPKLTNLDENIARLDGESYVAMENRNMPVADEELPLAVWQYRRTEYVMQLDLGTFDDLDVFLKDYYLNQETLLTENDVNNISFTVDNDIPASKEAGRFSVVFRATPLGNEVIEEAKGFSLFPNPLSGSELYINAPEGQESAQVVIYNTLGQEVFKANQNFTANNQLVLQTNNLEAGIYIVKVKTQTGISYSAKFIKE
jgi:hypothetical protein